MSIVEIRVDMVEPFADGQAFGEAGSYLRIKGIAKGEINPAVPENRVITDLEQGAEKRAWDGGVRNRLLHPSRALWKWTFA